MEVKNGELVRDFVLAAVFLAGTVAFVLSLTKEGEPFYSMLLFAGLSMATGVALSLAYWGRDFRRVEAPSSRLSPDSRRALSLAVGFVVVLVALGFATLASAAGHNGLSLMALAVCSLSAGLCLGHAAVRPPSS